jgi:hypothetical protein
MYSRTIPLTPINPFVQRLNNQRANPVELSKALSGKQKLFTVFRDLDPLLAKADQLPIWRSEQEALPLIERGLHDLDEIIFNFLFIKVLSLGCPSVFLGSRDDHALYALDVSSVSLKLTCQ